jgi:ubiquinone/menaquinone biosynthesis C-methylase UbiE
MLRRQYAKLCDLADFEDPELRARIREIAPGPGEDELHRKNWEYAMLALFLEDVGLLNDDARVLSVGAGHEEVLFWLANKVGSVVATDLYGEGDFSAREAEVTMLDDPSAFAPYPYREDRLEVRKMDGRALDLPDETFDAVFSLSSIEHFGSPGEISQAAREIARVLRPGGYAFVVTECFVRRHILNSKLVQTAIRGVTLGRRCATATPRARMLTVFTSEELTRYIVRPSRLELMQPLDRTISPATWANLIRWRGAGELTPATGRDFPHILLKAHGAAWTSVALPLRKP